jgi:hypothetical protein
MCGESGRSILAVICGFGQLLMIGGPAKAHRWIAGGSVLILGSIYGVESASATPNMTKSELRFRP